MTMPDKNTEVEKLFGDNFLDGDTPEEDGGATQFSVVGALDVAEFFYIAGLKRAVEIAEREGSDPPAEEADGFMERCDAVAQAITNEIKEHELRQPS